MANNITEIDRLEICRKCPLYKEDSFYGEVCNSAKYIKINEDGSESTSYFPRKGYTRGCGCNLRKSVKNPYKHCIVNK